MKKLVFTVGAVAVITALIVLSGCSSVPVRRDPAFGSSHPQNQGDHQGDSSGDKHGVLSNFDNQAKSLDDGLYVNETEEPILPLISKAGQTIDIEIYMMDDPDFRAILRERMAKGVRVRVIKDGSPIGEKCGWFDAASDSDTAECQDEKKLVGEIRSTNGGAFIPFDKADLCGVPGKSCFEHGKMIIVDGSIALLSSGNFGADNLCNLRRNPKACNRDYSYITRDTAIVPVLQKIFENDLAAKPYDLASVIAPVADRITVSPLSLQPLLDFIGSAATSIEIQNQYLKEPKINRLLADKAKAGIAVSVTEASLCSFGKPNDKEAQAWTAIMTPFDRAGIQSRFFTSQVKVGGKPGYLHAKAIVLDQGTQKARAWMGSVNGSTTAITLNREFGIFFNDPKLVAKLEGVMATDFASPGEESWQDSLQCAKDAPTGSDPGGALDVQ